MLFVRILCRDLRSVFVIEVILKLGGEEGSEKVSSNRFFEVETYENLEGRRTVSGIKDGMR